MKVAVVGSRSLWIEDLSPYLPEGVTEIVSGGACGIDTCARNYAFAHNINYTEFLPEYSRYKKAAPLMRNRQIVDYSDEVIVFWNGSSKGTEYVINYCKKTGRSHRIYHQ